MTCAVLAPVLLATLSSRPDLYAVKPKPVRPGVAVVDWQSLGSLLSGALDPAEARPGWFRIRGTGSIRRIFMPARRWMSG
jgi:hypothetical protein